VALEQQLQQAQASSDWHRCKLLQEALARKQILHQQISAASAAGQFDQCIQLQQEMDQLSATALSASII
jgi:hypothetical protein